VVCPGLERQSPRRFSRRGDDGQRPWPGIASSRGPSLSTSRQRLRARGLNVFELGDTSRSASFLPADLGKHGAGRGAVPQQLKEGRIGRPVLASFDARMFAKGIGDGAAGPQRFGHHQGRDAGDLFVLQGEKVAEGLDGGVVIAAAATRNAEPFGVPLKAGASSALIALASSANTPWAALLARLSPIASGPDTAMIGADTPVAAGGKCVSDHQAQRIGRTGYDGQPAPPRGGAGRDRTGIAWVMAGRAGASLPSFSALAFALARLSFFSASAIRGR